VVFLGHPVAYCRRVVAYAHYAGTWNCDRRNSVCKTTGSERVPGAEAPSRVRGL